MPDSAALCHSFREISGLGDGRELDTRSSLKAWVRNLAVERRVWVDVHVFDEAGARRRRPPFLWFTRVQASEAVMYSRSTLRYTRVPAVALVPPGTTGNPATVPGRDPAAFKEFVKSRDRGGDQSLGSDATIKGPQASDVLASSNR
ncbi:MAG: hypothetical protein JWP08_3431 [Bryobacterales bacterium]|nr:hypothetical protein [Bryobacterales bacterium]